MQQIATSSWIRRLPYLTRCGTLTPKRARRIYAPTKPSSDRWMHDASMFPYSHSRHICTLSTKNSITFFFHAEYSAGTCQKEACRPKQGAAGKKIMPGPCQTMCVPITREYFPKAGPCITENVRLQPLLPATYRDLPRLTATNRHLPKQIGRAHV